MAVERYEGRGTCPSKCIQRIDGPREAHENVAFAGMGAS
jgi:hypothetical protein